MITDQIRSAVYLIDPATDLVATLMVLSGSPGASWVFTSSKPALLRGCS
jgi:hypothetical protein